MLGPPCKAVAENAILLRSRGMEVIMTMGDTEEMALSVVLYELRCTRVGKSGSRYV